MSFSFWSMFWLVFSLLTTFFQEPFLERYNGLKISTVIPEGTKMEVYTWAKSSQNFSLMWKNRAQLETWRQNFVSFKKPTYRSKQETSSHRPGTSKCFTKMKIIYFDYPNQDLNFLIDGFSLNRSKKYYYITTSTLTHPISPGTARIKSCKLQKWRSIYKLFGDQDLKNSGYIRPRGRLSKN